MKSFLELLKTWGPPGAFAAGLIDGAGLPNPGGPDYLVLFLAWTSPGTAYLTALLSLLGTLAGSMILFWLARRGGEKYLDAHASGPRAMRFRDWFQRYGLVTVFIPALVPVIPLPMKIFVLSAGALGVRPSVFLAVMAAGKLPRFLALAWLGKTLGQHSTVWLKDHRWHFAGGVLLLGLLLFLLIRLADHSRGHAR